MRRLKSQAGKVKWANDRAGLATPASKAPHSCRRHVVRRTVASTRRPQQHSPPRSARSHGRRPVPSRPSMGRGLVSIRALAWRATIEIIRRDVLGLVFRSTPSHGVRHDDIRVVDKPGLFRSTPSHRGRPTIRTTSKRPRAFRSTPSHGGRPSRHAYIRHDQAGFDPRPRMEGDLERWFPSQQLSFDPRPRMEGDPISTGRLQRTFAFRSTPSHGGRPEIQQRDMSPSSFRSTPSHGGRRATGRSGRGREAGFDPRPRMEGDRRHDALQYARLSVSIHALAWRATSSRIGATPRSSGFDPRPRMEGDSRDTDQPRCQYSFRSTPSHGGRHLVGADTIALTLVSIHALAWRATAPDVTDFCASRNPGHCANRAVSDVKRLRFSQGNFKNVIFFRNMAVARTCRGNLARLRFARRARSVRSCGAAPHTPPQASSTDRHAERSGTTEAAWPRTWPGLAGRLHRDRSFFAAGLRASTRRAGTPRKGLPARPPGRLSTARETICRY